MSIYLDDLELAEHTIALADDIKNAAVRLLPVIEATRDPVEMSHLLDILKAANRLHIMHRGQAQLLSKKKNVKALENIVDEAFEEK